MKSLPRGPAGPGEVWPGASTDAPSPRKVSKHAAGGFRALGKRQNTSLEISEASERIPPTGPRILDRYPANLAGVPDAPRPRKGLPLLGCGSLTGIRQTWPVSLTPRGLGKGFLCHEKSLIGGVVPMRLLKRDRPPRGGADQRNPVPCLPESRTSFMLAGSTRRRTPAG